MFSLCLSRSIYSLSISPSTHFLKSSSVMFQSLISLITSFCNYLLSIKSTLTSLKWMRFFFFTVFTIAALYASVYLTTLERFCSHRWLYDNYTDNTSSKCTPWSRIEELGGIKSLLKEYTSWSLIPSEEPFSFLNNYIITTKIHQWPGTERITGMKWLVSEVTHLYVSFSELYQRNSVLLPGIIEVQWPEWEASGQEHFDHELTVQSSQNREQTTIWKNVLYRQILH